MSWLGLSAARADGDSEGRRQTAREKRFMATSRAVKPKRRHGRSDAARGVKGSREVAAPALRPKWASRAARPARAGSHPRHGFPTKSCSGSARPDRPARSISCPTVEFARAFGRMVRELAAPGGTVLEVAAGDGFLTLRSLMRARTWSSLAGQRFRGLGGARARGCRRSERRAKPDSVSGPRLGANVERTEAVAAIQAHQPDVVLARAGCRRESSSERDCPGPQPRRDREPGPVAE